MEVRNNGLTQKEIDAATEKEVLYIYIYIHFLIIKKIVFYFMLFYFKVNSMLAMLDAQQT